MEYFLVCRAVLWGVKLGGHNDVVAFFGERHCGRMNTAVILGAFVDDGVRLDYATTVEALQDKLAALHLIAEAFLNSTTGLAEWVVGFIAEVAFTAELAVAAAFGEVGVSRGEYSFCFARVEAEDLLFGFGGGGLSGADGGSGVGHGVLAAIDLYDGAAAVPAEWRGVGVPEGVVDGEGGVV